LVICVVSLVIKSLSVISTSFFFSPSETLISFATSITPSEAKGCLGVLLDCSDKDVVVGRVRSLVIEVEESDSGTFLGIVSSDKLVSLS